MSERERSERLAAYARTVAYGMAHAMRTEDNRWIRRFDALTMGRES